MSTSVHRHDLGLTWMETTGMRRAAHALLDGDRVWLIDPFEDATALAAAAELGRPAAVIQLLDRHNRDCSAIAQRLEVAHRRVPESVPESPFEVVPVIRQRWWKEVALWSAHPRALVVAEAVGTAPAFALGRRVGVHPMLRLTPPRSALLGRAPERLLVGHGPPVESGAAPALAEALDAARQDIPQLVLRLPSLLRDM
jgi:hypothetical protein